MRSCSRSAIRGPSSPASRASPRRRSSCGAGAIGSFPLRSARGSRAKSRARDSTSSTPATRRTKKGRKTSFGASAASCEELSDGPESVAPLQEKSGRRRRREHRRFVDAFALLAPVVLGQDPLASDLEHGRTADARPPRQALCTSWAPIRCFATSCRARTRRAAVFGDRIRGDGDLGIHRRGPRHRGRLFPRPSVAYRAHSHRARRRHHALRRRRAVVSLLALVMAIAAAVDRTTEATILLVLGLTSWLGTARVVRSKTIQVRDLDFVLASRALGSAPRSFFSATSCRTSAACSSCWRPSRSRR